MEKLPCIFWLYSVSFFVLLKSCVVRGIEYRNATECRWLSTLATFQYSFWRPGSSRSIPDAFLTTYGHHSRKPTCALVGNSPSLLQRSYGKVIDKADVVLRTNCGGKIARGEETLSLGKKLTFTCQTYFHHPSRLLNTCQSHLGSMESLS